MATNASPPSPPVAISRCAAASSICSHGRRRNHCGWNFSIPIWNRSASSISIRKPPPANLPSPIYFSQSRHPRPPSPTIGGKPISSFPTALKSPAPTCGFSKTPLSLIKRRTSRSLASAAHSAPSRQGISCWRKPAVRRFSASSTIGNAVAGTSPWSSATRARKNASPSWRGKIWSATSG